MRKFSKDNSSAKEYFGFVLFAVLIGSLVWLTHSSASSRSTEFRTESATVAPNPQRGPKNKPTPRCPHCAPAGSQEIYVPLIDLPEAQGSEIVFNSRSPQAMSVTPIFYKQNGTVITGDPVSVDSAEIRYVDIRQLLPERYRHERDWGGFSLSYNGFNREMWSQFRFLGVNGGTNVDEFFTVKSEARANSYEAAWWMPEKSEAIVALGNITDTATGATVTFSDGQSRTVSLAPHATEIIREDHSQREGPDSVVISVTGAPGSVIPTGLITAKNGSFNSVIRFYAPNAAKQPNLYANGFRVKGNTPHMVLKNTTSNSIAVVPKFTPLNGSSPFSLSQVSLPANATTEVDLTPLLNAARSRSDLDVVSVEVTNWAAPGSLVGSLYGINNETGMNYDIPLRDSGLVRTMTGSYPWKIGNDFTTVVYITNISDQDAQFVGEVNSHGAKVALDPRTLKPGETAVFDLQQFRDSQMADGKGNKLPKDATIGQFKWSIFGVTNGKLLLIGRAEMVSRSEHVSSSYSCNDPCPPYIWGWLDAFSPPVIIVNSTQQTSAWQMAQYDSGYQMGPYSAGAGYSIDTSNVTVDPTSGHTANLTGAEFGDACLNADMGSQERYSWDGLNCYDDGFSEPIGDTECTTVSSLFAFVNSPTVTNDGDAITAGRSFDLRVEVRNADGNRAPTDGSAAFNVENSSGTGESIPSGVNIVNGAGTASVTLLRVPGDGIYGRGYNVTYSLGGSSTNFHGHFQIWFDVIASDEGLVGNTTACGHVITNNDHFVALPATGLCNTTVQLVSGGHYATTTVRDVGPFYPDPSPNPCQGPSDRYWLTTGVPHAESDPCTSGAAIDLADGTFFQDMGLTGNTRILWRFGN